MSELFPRSNNAHCVPSCAVAVASKIALGRQFNDTDPVDASVFQGYDLYVRIRETLPPGGQFDFLDPLDLPNNFDIGHNSISAEYTPASQGVFPLHDTTVEWTEKVSALTDILLKLFSDDSAVNSKRVGYIFTGQNYTVAFWEDGCDYQLFNSHGVNRYNFHDNVDEGNNIARVFTCRSVSTLAWLLLVNAACDGNQRWYSVVRMAASVSEEPSQSSDFPIFDSTPEGSEGGRDSPVHLGTPEGSDAGNNVSQHFSSSLSSDEGFEEICPLPSPKDSDLPLAQRREPCISVAGRRMVFKRKPKKASAASGSDTDVPLSARVAGRSSVAKRKKKNAAPSSEASGSDSDGPLPGRVAGESASVASKVTLDLSPSPPKKKRGRPPKKKRGRPKQTAAERKKKNRENKKRHYDKKKAERVAATARSVSANPFPHREASKRYTEAHPEVHRDAAARYTEAHPEVNRDAVERYTAAHPEVNRDAVERYTAAHPEVNRDAVERYTAAHPEVNRDAVERYTQTHPEVHRDAVERYTQTHPEVHRDAVERYRDTHPDVERVRHFPASLRRSTLIGAFRGEQLDAVELYKLKRTSLLSPEVYRCPHCNAALFEEEKGRLKWCCGGGRSRVLRDMAPLEEDFYSDRDFLRHPRMYNDLFAMCALCTTWVHPQTGPRFVKIQGRCYHVSFDLSCPDRPGKRNVSALYIDDGQRRLEAAAEMNLNGLVTASIAAFLHETNPHVGFFKRLAREPSANARLVFDNAAPRVVPEGQINPQNTTGEVSALLCTSDEPVHRRQIVIWKIGQGRYWTVDSFHPLYEALQYPLLFPQGQKGWYPSRPDATGEHKLSQLEYLRCLLLSEPRFSMFGALSDTYLVDMYARVEHERLLFFKRAQAPGGLRVGPQDEIQAVADAQTNLTPGRGSGRAGRWRGAGRGRGIGRGRGSQAGTSGTGQLPRVPHDVVHDETIQGEGLDAGRVYLPNTFVGGPRYFRQKYFDAMAICTRLGNPHFFLTFTANARWCEYKESCRRGCGQGEAHVCARVFRLKLDELMRDLRSGRLFGTPAYIIHTIEFQARGLVHAHVIFRLKGNVPLNSEFADQFIRADIPSAEEAGGRLRKLVLDNMVHGPHPARTNLPCWDSSKAQCRKRYPKPHNPSTYYDERGFYHYRRDSTNTATVRNRGRDVTISDCDIVPYNAALLLKYGAHINLELATARRVVKYLFKYINKGDTLARVAVVEDEQNEVEDYVTRRSIGAGDAAWRTLGFNMTGREPTVMTLPVHLEGKNMVLFERGTEAQAAQSKSLQMLYFERPHVPALDDVSYLEFYEKFIVHSKRPSYQNVPIYDYEDGRHFVTPRQRGASVSRLYFVSPKMGEQYYLRMLLQRFPCRGYKDLYLLGGDECSSFQEACRAKGLLNDEQEYVEAMQEAATFMTGPRLRSLFVTMCNIGAPAAVMWANCKSSLCEDFYERVLDMQRAENMALVDIGRSLRRNGTSLVEQGLPDVEDEDNEVGRERFRYSAAAQQALAAEWEPRLSQEQRQVADEVFGAVADVEAGRDTPRGRAFFLDAPGGTGKTTLAKYMAAKLRAENKIVLCVASSGIAAINMQGGRTAHSMFKLPLDFGDGSGTWGLTNGSQRADLIRQASLIWFDEAPMAHRFLIEVLERSLRDLMQNNLPFGNKVIVFSGDPRQLGPVVPEARTSADILAASLRSSPLFTELRRVHLSVAHRQAGSEAYATFLMDVGNGTLPQRTLPDETVPLVGLSQVNRVVDRDSLIDFVFPAQVLSDPDECSKRALLCTHNVDVDDMTEIILGLLAGEDLVCASADFVREEDSLPGEFFDDELLHQATSKGVPPHLLTLKKGAVCMITRNLNSDAGLVNGAKVIVVDVTPRLVVVRFPGSQELMAVPRITFKFPIVPDSPLHVTRRQFPLRVAYAVTVHKAQGLTLEKVGVDLRTDPFAHGLLYTALSRVRSPDDIVVLVPEHRVVSGVPYTRNVVIRDLLS